MEAMANKSTGQNSMIQQPSLFPVSQYHAQADEDSNQWFTPDTSEQPVLSLVKTSLGGVIGLDCTADPDRRVPALRHFTEADNCLDQVCNQGETIFCNPPYDNPFPFVQWVAYQVAADRCPAAVMLCKAGVMSNQGTGAMIQLYASAVCHWRHNGRINFIPGAGVIARFEREYAEGKRKSPEPTSADFDTAAIYFGRNWRLFAATWQCYGTLSLLPNAWKK